MIMWNSNLSPEININRTLVERFKKYATVSGILFILLGLAGILFPAVVTFSTVLFIAYLMLLAGISAAWMTWKSNRQDWAGWLKSTMLVLVSILMIFFPMDGVAALGLLFSIYFFIDAFAGFGLAFSMRPKKIWWLWLINAVTSLALGVLFIVGWPFSSVYMIGIFVGVSLLFDGFALLAGGSYLDTLEEDEQNKDISEKTK